jgi:23S rRNA (pseudouridine1915-N3)-methyltransferase
MKITVLAIGQRQPRWADDAIADFVARFPADFAVTINALKAEARNKQAEHAGRAVAKILAAEATRLRAARPPRSILVACDERGHDWSTAELARQISRWRGDAEDVCFAIGGADGLADDIKHEARTQLRLSSLTLPHALARVVLVEQLYRAWSILAGHPYHRA